MNNQTLTMFPYFNYDLEVLNIAQTSISLLCSIIILFKVFDVSSVFQSVKETRIKQKKQAELKEFNRLKSLFEKMNNTKIDIELVSEEDEEDEKEEGDSGIMRIARKKKKMLDSHV